MTHGLDTSFLVAVEVAAHPEHRRCRARFQKRLRAGERFALAPQVLAEFIHVVTDPRRFSAPLTMPLAVELAELWWNAVEVVRVFPTAESMLHFLGWLREHRLGRKRLLDTLLASTYRAAGVNSVLTLDPGGFEVFGGFVVS